jgi:type VII secretion-associated protein (TIGR03931 family)
MPRDPVGPGELLDRPVVRPGPPVEVPEPAPTALGADLLPPPTPGRRIRPSVALTVAGILAAGSLSALVTAALTAAHPAPPEPAVLAQYDYALRIPAGWRHAGGDPERRRTLLTPAAAPAGSDLIAVEQSALGYDSDAEPDRARAEFADAFAADAAADPALHGPPRPDRVGGRPVLTYRQSDGPTTIDWYVLFDRDAQLSVGCRHTAAGAATVAAACAEVLATLGHRDR